PDLPTTPVLVLAGSGPVPGQRLSTSQAVTNFPIIDSSAAMPASADVRVIGFLQGFSEAVNPGGSALWLRVRILNIAGCGNNPGSTSVQAGGTSAIPVRLISQ